MYKTVISKIQEFQTVVVCLCHRSDVLLPFRYLNRRNRKKVHLQLKVKISALKEKQ